MSSIRSSSKFWLHFTIGAFIFLWYIIKEMAGRKVLLPIKVHCQMTNRLTKTTLLCLRDVSFPHPVDVKAHCQVFPFSLFWTSSPVLLLQANQHLIFRLLHVKDILDRKERKWPDSNVWGLSVLQQNTNIDTGVTKTIAILLVCFGITFCIIFNSYTVHASANIYSKNVQWAH